MTVQTCNHDWCRPDDHYWWDCSHCDKKMHPSWTPETRAQFEAACDILRLQLTAPDDVVTRIANAGR